MLAVGGDARMAGRLVEPQCMKTCLRLLVAGTVFLLHGELLLVILNQLNDLLSHLL